MTKHLSGFLLIISFILPIIDLSRTFQSTSLSSLLCLDCFITITSSFLFWFCWGAAFISVMMSFTSIVIFYIISLFFFLVFSSSGLLNCFPFLSQGAFVFSLNDVQEMDALLSTLDVFEMTEAGPLFLAWAVFLCLISSLPGKEENNVLTVCFCCFLFSSHSLPLPDYVWCCQSWPHFFLNHFRKLIMLAMFVKPLKLHHWIVFLKSFKVIY